jgi:hypothetical protein
MNGKSNVELLKYADEYRDETREQAFANWTNLLADGLRLESLADGAPGITTRAIMMRALSSVTQHGESANRNP